MGGSSKKQTVSWWYKLIAHFGLSLGPIDALLEIRGGDRTAWQGEQTTSGTISVNKPELYGGEKKEGGIVGDFELMMGEPDQAPNSYLAQWFGAMQGAYRGLCTIIFKGGKIGAGNPYPKALWFKVRRLLKGWDNDVCWYPSKAAVPVAPPSSETIPATTTWEYQIVDHIVDTSTPETIVPPSSGYVGPAPAPFGRAGTGGTLVPEVPISTFWGYNTSLWLRKTVSFGAGPITISGYVENALIVFVDGVIADSVNLDNTQSAEPSGIPYNIVLSASPGLHEIHMLVLDEDDGEPPPSDAQLQIQDNTYFYAVMSAHEIDSSVLAMNPAHILYDSITSRKETGGMGEPVGKVNDASFTAAADKFYAEGFGLCMKRVGGQTAEEFQQRICDIAGVCLTQDQTDGQYYIDMLRGDYVLEDLQVITDDDVLSWSAEPTATVGAVNQMQVKYFDVEKRADGITTPVQALGAIVDSGGVIPGVKDYPEIPVESLALRVADRDLNAANTPTWRFDLTCNRKAYKLRPGVYVRLMCPKRGFADVVAVIGDVAYGELDDSAIRLEAVQDIFGLADAVYAQPQESVDPSGLEDPEPATDAVAMEAPYIEIAAVLSQADLNVLDPEVGYLGVAATRPGNAWNYSLATKAAGEEYEESVNGDWCPAADIIEDADYLDTNFTIENELDLDRVTVGSWALWEDEIVKVNDLDAVALTVSLGRGCADTVPAQHAAGSRILFCGDWLSTDGRQYLTGETVNAKVLTRTGADKLDISEAPELSVVMDERQYRPYPPANILVNGVAYPTAAGSGPITITYNDRDRLLQADQLIDTTAAGVGPEAGTTVNVRYRVSGSLVHEDTGVTGGSVTWATPAEELMTVEIESERDGLTSFQMHSFQIDWRPGEVVPSDPYAVPYNVLLHFDGADGSTVFTDQSGLPWTKTGNAEIDTAQSRFGGSSLHLDGAGSYLTTPNHATLTLAGVDYTIECFVRPAVSKAEMAVITKRPASFNSEFGVWINNGKVHVAAWAAGNVVAINLTGAISVPINTWSHIAITVSGTTWRVFVNGVLDVSGTASAAIVGSTESIYVGRDRTDTSRDFNGHIDELRLTQNKALYVEDFSPPNAPFTDYETVCLFHFEGADGSTTFLDQSGKTWAVNGNIQIDTSRFKFGSASALLDGNNDYLTLAHHPQFSLEDSEFTVECWVYRAVSGAQHYLLSKRPSASGSIGWEWRINADNTLQFFYTGGTSLTSTLTVPSGEWVHLATVRDGNTFRHFINGAAAGSVACSNGTKGTVSLFVGIASDLSGDFNGNIDELRITKGIARYTAAFTPPDAPFPDSV